MLLHVSEGLGDPGRWRLFILAPFLTDRTACSQTFTVTARDAQGRPLYNDAVVFSSYLTGRGQFGRSAIQRVAGTATSEGKYVATSSGADMFNVQLGKCVSSSMPLMLPDICFFPSQSC